MIMSAKQETLEQRISKLEADNKRLNKKMVKITDSNSPTSRSRSWRSAAIILLIGLAGALLIVGNLLFWTGQTLIDNNRYTEATAPLIQDPDIQNAIANKTTQAIFSRVDVEAIAKEALPPRAEFLAPSLSQQVQTFTNQKTKEILANPSFQDTWNKVNSRAHERLINGIKNYDGDGTFDIQDLYNKVSEKLFQNKLSFLGGKQLPAKVGSITIVTASNLPTLHWIVVNLWWIRLLAILLFVILTAAAVAVAKNRRRALSRISIVYASLLFALLIALRMTRTFMVGKVTQEYQAAATAAWSIILHSLFLQIIGLIVLFIVIALGAWLTGGGRRAKLVRVSWQKILNGKVHQVLFKKENNFTWWVSKNMRAMIIGLSVLAGLALLIVHISVINIVVIVVALLLLIGVVQLLAAKK